MLRKKIEKPNPIFFDTTKMPRCIEKTLKGTRCKANGLEHEGSVRCNTHRHMHIIANAVEVPDFAPTPDLYNHNRYMMPTVEGVAAPVQPQPDAKDIRIAELTQQLADLMKEKRRVEFDAIGKELSDHCWHLDYSDDVVYDWWYEAYEAKGWNGLYKSIKGANTECSTKDCDECKSILQSIEWRCN